MSEVSKNPTKRKRKEVLVLGVWLLLLWLLVLCICGHLWSSLYRFFSRDISTMKMFCSNIYVVVSNIFLCSSLSGEVIQFD